MIAGASSHHQSQSTAILCGTMQSQSLQAFSSAQQIIIGQIISARSKLGLIRSDMPACQNSNFSIKIQLESMYSFSVSAAEKYEEEAS